jgi:hypothetical protein
MFSAATHHDSVLLAMHCCWCILRQCDAEHGSAALMHAANVQQLQAAHSTAVAEWAFKADD